VITKISGFIKEQHNSHKDDYDDKDHEDVAWKNDITKFQHGPKRPCHKIGTSTTVHVWFFHYNNGHLPVNGVVHSSITVVM